MASPQEFRDSAACLNLLRSLANQPGKADPQPEDLLRAAAKLEPGHKTLGLDLYEYERDTIARVHSLTWAGDDPPGAQLTDWSVYRFRPLLAALQTGQPLVIADASSNLTLSSDTRDALAAEGIAQLTLLPLIPGENLLGLLWIADLLSDEQLPRAQVLTYTLGVQVQSQALAEAWRWCRLSDDVQPASEPARLLEAALPHFEPKPDRVAIVALNSDVSPLLLAAVGADGARADLGQAVTLAHQQPAIHAHLTGGEALLINHVKADTSLPDTVRESLAGEQVGALALIPVLHDGQLSHSVAVTYPEPHLFTRAEVRLLYRLAGQIDSAAQRWALQTQLQQQGERLARQAQLIEALYHVSWQISTQPTSADSLQAACQQIAQALDSGYAAVVRFDQVPAAGNLVAEYPARLGGDTLLALHGFGAYRRLQTSREPLVLAPLESSGDKLLGPNLERFQMLGAPAVLLAPLRIQDDLIGALVLASGQSGSFLPEETRVAQTIASQIAVGLRNMEYFVEIQRWANLLERSAAFGRMVTSTFDEAAILRRVVDIIPSLLPADQVGIALYRPGETRMRLITLRLDNDPEEGEQPAEGTSVQEVAQTQSPILVADLRSSAYPDHADLVGRGLNAALIAPLVVGGRVMGALTIAHRRARVYTPTDLALAQQLANQIAIGLENARQFSLTRHRAQYEESLNAITSRLQQHTELRDMLQQTVQDLGQVLGARRARVRLQPTPAPVSVRLSQSDE
ncbi:MAG: GAF domain-containing protein [Chloroflexi bacterium]|nr:GAF domain-containing protein [Chloroflexota bacterium]